MKLLFERERERSVKWNEGYYRFYFYEWNQAVTLSTVRLHDSVKCYQCLYMRPCPCNFYFYYFIFSHWQRDKPGWKGNRQKNTGVKKYGSNFFCSVLNVGLKGSVLSVWHAVQWFEWCESHSATDEYVGKIFKCEKHTECALEMCTQYIYYYYVSICLSMRLHCTCISQIHATIARRHSFWYDASCITSITLFACTWQILLSFNPSQCVDRIYVFLPNHGCTNCIASQSLSSAQSREIQFPIRVS